MGYKAGVTLIELLITVAIAGILATLAAPSFEKIINDNRLATATNELVATLHFARMEAIRRGKWVIICESDGKRCTNDGDWANGWIVFVDTDRNGRFHEQKDDLLLVHGPFKGGLTILFNRGNRLTYLHSGWLRGFVGGRFTLCTQKRGNYGREVVLNAVGRIRIERKVICPPPTG